MHCPKCGTENPDDAQICDSCSFAFTEQPTDRPALKKKTSKLAIVSALLAGLSAVLLLFVDPTLAFLVALLSFSAAITSIVKIRKSKGTLVGKSFAIASVIFVSLHLVATSFWRIDAPPIPNDYTISDIRSAPPQYNQSYELLNSLADEEENLPDAPAIGLSAQDINELEEINKVFGKADYAKIADGLRVNTDAIMRIWKNAEKGRNVITNLSKFPQIADLSEPSLEIKLPWLKNLRRLLHINRAYVCIHICLGNDDIAIEELLKLDNVFRKLNLNARFLVTKLVCMACFASNIQTANFIINNPQTSEESVELLAQHFTPLTNEDIYLRNSIIVEYLTCKNELTKIFTKTRMKYLTYLPFKLNSSLRVYRNFYCDSWIAAEENRQYTEEFSVWPSIYPKLPVRMNSNGNFPWYYKAYNPIGPGMVRLLSSDFERISQIKIKLQIHSDLLQIVLNKRLGKGISLKARAYSDEYIIDVENKKIFSPGPDGIPHNDDDIKLTINPEVLGFSD
jgi:uncharacterized protein (DUF983 family)